MMLNSLQIKYYSSHYKVVDVYFSIYDEGYFKIKPLNNVYHNYQV